MLKILVVEDDLRLSELLKKVLETKQHQVIIANEAKKGFQLFKNQTFDFVITDILLPDWSGIKLTKKIKKHNPLMPILMLTALWQTDDKINGFEAGADDYMVKPFEIRELMVRIDVIHKRFKFFETTKITKLNYADLTLDLLSKTLSRQNQTIILTPKELKLITFLMQNPEKVLTRDEIAKEVWQTNHDTGTNFIDVYINYLRNKIDKNFDSKLIHTKSGIGFYLKEIKD